MKNLSVLMCASKLKLSALAFTAALASSPAFGQSTSNLPAPSSSGTSANIQLPASNLVKENTDIYIVEFDEKPAMEYQGGMSTFSATAPLPGARINTASATVQSYRSFLQSSHNQALRNCGVNEQQKIYSYDLVFNGMAVRMSEAQAALMKSESNVKAVYKDRLLKMHTDSTREFMELNKRRDGAWRRGITGENVIVGVLDSGIHPENPSFADIPTKIFGDRGPRIPFGPPPQKWQGDECDFGNTSFNPEDAPFECNNKILGARSYVSGFLNGRDPAVALAPKSSLSARDDNGHGSAAASNAAGNFGVQAVIAGEEVGEGLMSGVAPRARIAAYKVCWDGPLVDDPTTPGNEDTDDGCANSDSMAAIDQAVADGVDVINFSVGGASVSFGAPDARAFLNAAGAGVHVASSAGNSGPDAATVGAPAVAPWITSVGAVNDDQNFALAVDVTEPASLSGPKTAIEGAGPVLLEDIAPISSELVVADPANGCSSLTNASDLSGKVALVIRGECGFNDKYAEAEAAGAIAIVVYNDGTASDRLNPIVMSGLDASRTIPGVMIGFEDGAALANESGVGITLDAESQVTLANRVVDFSSRGPNRGALDIIKPDVVAPGVGILSAETPFENTDAGAGGESQQFISGTSFSSPHVAGAMALIKQVRPDWSPAMVRSALMTTARQDIMTQFSDQQATPFDMGAGHIVPNDSFNPGLVYDVSQDEYSAFSCANNAQQVSDQRCEELAAQGFSFDATQLNLPSIGVSELVGRKTITRRVVNSDYPSPFRFFQRRSIYKAIVEAPEGTNVTVQPRYLALYPGQEGEYSVTFDALEGSRFGEFEFGSITWVELGKRRKNYRQTHPRGHSLLLRLQGNSKWNESRWNSGHDFGWGSDQFGGFYGGYFSNLFGFAREVRSPIAVRSLPLSAPQEIDVVGDAATVAVPVQFGYSGVYSAQLSGLASSFGFPGSVTEADGLSFVCFDLPAFEHLRIATFDEETGSPGADDLDLRVFRADDCASFANLQQIGSSGGVSSSETVDLSNPVAGGYIFVVDYFAAATGSQIDYVLNITPVAGDLGNAVLTAPSSAVSGQAGSADVTYAGLPTGRYLGLIRHSDANIELARTLIDITVAP